MLQFKASAVKMPAILEMNDLNFPLIDILHEACTYNLTGSGNTFFLLSCCLQFVNENRC